MAGISGLGLLATFLMEGLPLHSVVDEAWTLKQKEGPVEEQERTAEEGEGWKLKHSEYSVEKQAETSQSPQGTEGTRIEKRADEPETAAEGARKPREPEAMEGEPKAAVSAEEPEAAEAAEAIPPT